MRWISKDSSLSQYLINSTGKGNYNTGNPIPTGSNSAYQIKNIYDMAGNVREWTMETFSADSRVHRGGNYNDPGSNFPVTNRYGLNLNYSYTYLGFRVALYV